ncbi:Major capsid protein [Candidatus Magnetomoraceae bacterium gMMP-15]
MDSIELIRSLFTPAAIAKHIKKLPPVISPVYDQIYKTRGQHPFPYIGHEEIVESLQTAPVIKRGGSSTPVTTDSTNYSFYEPMPVKPSVLISAKELNDLKVLGKQSKDAWVRDKIIYLRRIVRRTTEGLCAISLKGKVQWPLQMNNGSWDTYELDFGTPNSVTPTKMWDASDVKIKDVFTLFQSMKKVLTQTGYGVSLEIWAGESAFAALLAMAEDFKSTVKMKVEVTAEYIDLAGFRVFLHNEPIQNPQTKAFGPTIPDKEIMMYSKAADFFFKYCAIDNLKANLKALPIFINPVELRDGSGIELIGESKPFPGPRVRAICWATVVS